jgi:hypothetical protein
LRRRNPIFLAEVQSTAREESTKETHRGKPRGNFNPGRHAFIEINRLLPLGRARIIHLRALIVSDPGRISSKSYFHIPIGLKNIYFL